MKDNPDQYYIHVPIKDMSSPCNHGNQVTIA